MTLCHADGSCEYFSENVNTVAIAGLGLLGGSLALKLKQVIPDLTVLGLARRDQSITDALRQGMIDDGATTPERILPRADLTVLCTPVSTVIDLAEHNAGLWRRGTIVTDVGSVKKEIVDTLTPILHGRDVAFVGGHPMAGSDKSGLDYADAELYADSSVLLTPIVSTDTEALQIVKAMWKMTGAIPYSMAPAVHDQLLGRTSHLVHLLAAAAVDVCLDSDEALYTTGGGFRDFSRIAAGNAEMWRQIFQMNKEPLLQAIQLYEQKLEDLHEWVQNDQWDELQNYMATTGRMRSEWFEAWTRNRQQHKPEEE